MLFMRVVHAVADAFVYAVEQAAMTKFAALFA